MYYLCINKDKVRNVKIWPYKHSTNWTMLRLTLLYSSTMFWYWIILFHDIKYDCIFTSIKEPMKKSTKKKDISYYTICSDIIYSLLISLTYWLPSKSNEKKKKKLTVNWAWTPRRSSCLHDSGNRRGNDFVSPRWMPISESTNPGRTFSPSSVSKL